MSIKQKILISLALFICFGLGVFSLGGYGGGECYKVGSFACYEIPEITMITLFFHIPITLFLFLIPLLQENNIVIWRKITIFFTAILLLILVIPMDAGGSKYIGPHPKVLYPTLLLIIYFIISIGYILISLFLSRKKNKV